MKKNTKIRQNSLLVFCILVILLLGLWDVKQYAGPYIWDDELGYWSHAANLAGTSWKRVEDLWYSYGYSLLLVPLFWITHNMVFLYRMAIVLNGVMCVILFLIGREILTELGVELKEETKTLISFVATCYSGYIFQSHVARSEIMIYCGIYLVIWTFIKFAKSPSLGKQLLLTLEICMLYLVHNRNMVSIIAYLMILICMVWRKKLDWRYLLCPLILFLGFGLWNGQMKVFLSQAMWELPDGFVSNDSATVLGNVKELLRSLDGWLRLFISFAGKIWYMLAASLLLSYWGGVFIVRQIAQALSKETGEENDWRLYVYGLIALVVLGTIAVTTLSMVPPDYTTQVSGRLDMLVYGRYSDGVMGILILLGLAYVAQNKRSRFEMLFGLGLYGIVALLSCTILHDMLDPVMSYVSIPGILYHTVPVQVDGYIEKATLFFLVAILAVHLILLLQHQGRILLFSACLVGFFVFIANTGEKMIVSDHTCYRPYEPLYDILCRNDTYPMVYLSDHHLPNDPLWKKLRTQVVNATPFFGQIPKEEDHFVLLNQQYYDYQDDMLSEYHLIGKYGEIWAFAKGTQLQERLTNQGIPLFSLDQIDPLDVTDYQLDAELAEAPQVGGEEIQIDVILQDARERFLVNQNNCKLSYHIYDESGREILHDGPRYEVGGFLYDGQRILVKIKKSLLKGKGTCRISFDLVQDGLAWYEELGGDTATVEFSMAQ